MLLESHDSLSSPFPSQTLDLVTAYLSLCIGEPRRSGKRKWNKIAEGWVGIGAGRVLSSALARQPSLLIMSATDRWESPGMG